MTKECSCHAIILPFLPCTGEKCKTCKGEGHVKPAYCHQCQTFTHPVYGV